MGLEWLDPLGFNNTFAMVIRGEDARKNKIATLSDAARYSPGWNLGVGYEFQQRPDGLEGLLKTYHLAIHGSPKTMDLGLMYRALASREVDVVAGDATSAQIAALDLVVLRDDRGYFPPYDAVPVVRTATLLRHPRMARALGRLAGRVSVTDMQAMNRAVDIERRDVSAVVRQFLTDRLAITSK